MAVPTSRCDELPPKKVPYAGADKTEPVCGAASAAEERNRDRAAGSKYLRLIRSTMAGTCRNSALSAAELVDCSECRRNLRTELPVRKHALLIVALVHDA